MNHDIKMRLFLRKVFVYLSALVFVCVGIWFIFNTGVYQSIKQFIIIFFKTIFTFEHFLRHLYEQTVENGRKGL